MITRSKWVAAILVALLVSKYTKVEHVVYVYVATQNIFTGIIKPEFIGSLYYWRYYMYLLALAITIRIFFTTPVDIYQKELAEFESKEGADLFFKPYTKEIKRDLMIWPFRHYEIDIGGSGWTKGPDKVTLPVFKADLRIFRKERYVLWRDRAWVLLVFLYNLLSKLERMLRAYMVFWKVFVIFLFFLACFLTPRRHHGESILIELKVITVMLIVLCIIICLALSVWSLKLQLYNNDEGSRRRRWYHIFNTQPMSVFVSLAAATTLVMLAYSSSYYVSPEIMDRHYSFITATMKWINRSCNLSDEWFAYARMQRFFVYKSLGVVESIRFITKYLIIFALPATIVYLQLMLCRVDSIQLGFSSVDHFLNVFNKLSSTTNIYKVTFSSPAGVVYSTTPEGLLKIRQDFLEHSVNLATNHTDTGHFIPAQWELHDDSVDQSIAERNFLLAQVTHHSGWDL